MSYFQFSFKLMEKSLNGSAVAKRCSPPATPCDRVIGYESASADVKAKLAKQQSAMDPVALLHTIREAQSAMPAIAPPEITAIPRGESLAQFLARLPDRWRQDEGASSQGAKVREPRTWRTRKYPFEGVWRDVLGWLQGDLDARAVALLSRLHSADPDRFTRTHCEPHDAGCSSGGASWWARCLCRGGHNSVGTGYSAGIGIGWG